MEMFAVVVMFCLVATTLLLMWSFLSPTFLFNKRISDIEKNNNQMAMGVQNVLNKLDKKINDLENKKHRKS